MAHRKVYIYDSSLCVIEAESTSSIPRHLHIVPQLCFPVGSSYICVWEIEKVRQRKKRWETMIVMESHVVLDIVLLIALLMYSSIMDQNLRFFV